MIDKILKNGLFIMIGCEVRRDNATPLPEATTAAPTPSPQPNLQDDNECFEYQQEDVQVHNLNFSGEMKKLADVSQNCNMGPSVAITKFSGKTQELVTA